MYRILQQTIQARIQALVNERYGVELAQLAFQALLEDVQREKPNAKGTEYILKTSFVLRDSTAMNAEKARG